MKTLLGINLHGLVVIMREQMAGFITKNLDGFTSIQTQPMDFGVGIHRMNLGGGLVNKTILLQIFFTFIFTPRILKKRGGRDLT